MENMMGIVLKHISYKYKDQWNGKNAYALKDISLSVEKGEYIGVIGQTGSGKTTLMQHLNGLLKPEFGTYFFDGKDVYQKGFSEKKLRQKVALCFQYPEYQLFEETVLKDICFGPKNMGYSEEECVEKARKSMELLGLSRELESLSPFSLSGGQKRRVALAGILAMEPDYLVLDEPAAGLDYEGKQKLFSLLNFLNKEKKITIFLVSHDMNDVAMYTKRVLVMHEGSIILDGTVREIFSKKEQLYAAGLELPEASCFYLEWRRETEKKEKCIRKNIEVKNNWTRTDSAEKFVMPLTVEELAECILRKKGILGEKK